MPPGMTAWGENPVSGTVNRISRRQNAMCLFMFAFLQSRSAHTPREGGRLRMDQERSISVAETQLRQVNLDVLNPGVIVRVTHVDS